MKNRVKHIRIDMGMTQPEFAALLGRDIQAIRRVEKTSTRLNDDWISLFWERLQLPPNELYEETASGKHKIEKQKVGFYECFKEATRIVNDNQAKLDKISEQVYSMLVYIVAESIQDQLKRGENPVVTESNLRLFLELAEKRAGE